MERDGQIVTIRLDGETLDALDRLATTLAASKFQKAELAALLRGGRVTRSMVVRLLIARGLEALAQEAVQRSSGKAWDESSRPTGRPRTLDVGSDIDDDLEAE